MFSGELEFLVGSRLRLGQSLIIRSDGGRIFHNLKHGKQNGIFLSVLLWELRWN